MKMRLKDKILSLFSIATILLSIILLISAHIQYPVCTEENTNLHTGICVSVKSEYKPSLNRLDSNRITIIELANGNRFFLSTTHLLKLGLTVSEIEAQCVNKPLNIRANKSPNKIHNAYDIAELEANGHHIISMSFTNSLNSESRTIVIVFSGILIAFAIGLFLLDRIDTHPGYSKKGKTKKLKNFPKKA